MDGDKYSAQFQPFNGTGNYALNLEITGGEDKGLVKDLKGQFIALEIGSAEPEIQKKANKSAVKSNISLLDQDIIIFIIILAIFIVLLILVKRKKRIN